MSDDSGYFFPPQVKRNLDLASSLMETAVTLYKTSGRYDKDAYRSMAAQSLELMEDNCRRCIREVSRAAEANQRVCSRSKFLLRLVVSRFAHLIKPRSDGILDRAIIPGIDQYLLKLLGAVTYHDLNRHAEIIVGYTQNDGDVLWNDAVSSHTGRILVIGVFGRIIERFRNFEHAKLTFVSIVNSRGGHFVTDEQFRVIFYYMFNRLYQMADENPDEVDVVLGEDATASIKAIYEAAMNDNTLRGAAQAPRRQIPAHRPVPVRPAAKPDSGAASTTVAG